MNTVSIISVCIAFLSFIFSTVWSAANARRSRNKEYQDLLVTIKAESAEKSEMQVLFKEMNKNLERIVEDNKKNDIQLETVCLKYVVRISDEDNQTLHDYCSQAIESGVRNEDIHSVTPIGCAHLSIDNKMPNLLFYPPMHPQPVDSLTKKMVSLSGIDMKYWYK